MDEEHYKKLVAEYIRLRNDRNIKLVESKMFFFRKLLPLMRSAIESRREHVPLRNRKTDTLVSLMGFSPETTVITTLILRPRKLVVAYSSSKDSEDAEECFNQAVKYLVDADVLSFANIEHRPINAFDPKDIYDTLKSVIRLTGAGVVDVTGGTKLMSATAGHLAWELSLDLCYLDGGWDPKIGGAGLQAESLLRFYNNPSQQLGYDIRKQGVDLYNDGSFVAALKAFDQSRNHLEDDAFERVGIALCKCYTALADLNRDELNNHLVELRYLMGYAGVRSLLAGVEMDSHVRAMSSLANADSKAILAAFLELAEIYRKQARHDFASLLAYRAMEAMVEAGLQDVNPKFSMNRPDYSLLGDKAWLEQEAAVLDGSSRRPLPPAVGLEAGFALLLILNRVRLEPFGNLRREDILGRIKGYATKRNQSILAHGNRTLSQADSVYLLEGAKIISQAIEGVDVKLLEQLRIELRPRVLPYGEPPS